MGLVSGFTDEIVSPLEIAASQIRQLSRAHIDANNHLQGKAQALLASFAGNASNAFLTMVHKQGHFITGITGELDDTAGIFEQVAGHIKDAAQVADRALGGPLLDIGEHVLAKLSPPIVIHQGQSAISAIIDDMRQTFHQLLHHTGSFFSDIVTFNFSGAFHDAVGSLSDLAHLGEDIFALLDQAETILGRWAAEVMERSNWLMNALQSILFKIEDFLFGISDIDENSAILADPNASPLEKGLAAAGITLTVAGDILLLIPGAEEGGVAEKAVVKEVEEEVEQEVEKEIEQEAEKEIEQEVEKEVEQEVEKEVEQEVEKEIGQQLELPLEWPSGGMQMAFHFEWEEVEKEIQQQVGKQLELPLEWGTGEAEKEIEQQVGKQLEKDLEKEGLSGLDKLKLGQGLARGLLNGDPLAVALFPPIRKALEGGLEKVTTWGVKKALLGKYGEEGVQKILESQWTKLIQQDALDKTREVISKYFIGHWLSGPYERFKQGLITGPELEKETRALADQIMQNQPVISR